MKKNEITKLIGILNLKILAENKKIRELEYEMKKRKCEIKTLKDKKRELQIQLKEIKIKTKKTRDIRKKNKDIPTKIIKKYDFYNEEYYLPQNDNSYIEDPYLNYIKKNVVPYND